MIQYSSFDGYYRLKIFKQFWYCGAGYISTINWCWYEKQGAGEYFVVLTLQTGLTRRHYRYEYRKVIPQEDWQFRFEPNTSDLNFFDLHHMWGQYILENAKRLKKKCVSDQDRMHVNRDVSLIIDIVIGVTGFPKS